jgi:IS30 family transposase
MRKYQQLTQEERYRITALRRIGMSQAEVARELGRSASTISRELRRNRTTHDGGYRAEKAHSYASARRRRSRRVPWYRPDQLARVEALLRQHWSPEQITGYLRGSGVCRMSHETIYRHILRDKRRGGELYTYTRIMSKYGRKRYRRRDCRGVLAGKRHISERPVEVESRRELGHWEGDTVIG